MKIVMIGAGNLAVHLSKALQHSGCDIIQVYSRTGTSAKTLADALHTRSTASFAEIATDAALYIVAVSDDAVSEVAEHLPLTNQLVVHTAGSVPMDVFSGKMRNYGVMYPLQTFSLEYPLDFSVIPLFLEANSSENMRILESVAGKISDKLYQLSSEKRLLLHLAAVFGSNFVNSMYALADRLLRKANLDFDVLSPLILETARKAIASNHPEQVQTGPAKRNDQKVMQQHIEQLSGHSEWQRLYRQMSDCIFKQQHE